MNNFYIRNTPDPRWGKFIRFLSALIQLNTGRYTFFYFNGESDNGKPLQREMLLGTNVFYGVKDGEVVSSNDPIPNLNEITLDEFFA